MPLRPRQIVALVLLSVVGVTACSRATSDEEATPDAVQPGDLATKPDLVTVLPDDRGDPPTQLETEDLVEGVGEQAQPGDRLTVDFVGASWTSGQQFDATWDRGQPYSFTLGRGEVIEGWDRGLAGMREGGRRVLVIPPELAYGDRGAAAGIEPGETVVFIVDLVDVAEGPGVAPPGEETDGPD